MICDQWGKAIPRLDTRQFDHMVLATGEPGEIVVSGAHVLPGYLQGEGDAETKFDVEGTRWHRTGDLGYLDAKGRLWLLGRCSAKIEDAHGTLYSFAVECAAVENPSIRRAAMVSIAGRRVLAVETATPIFSEKIQPTAAISSEEIQRSLAWAKVDQVVVLDRIPVDKRHNAKIDYIALNHKLANFTRP